MRRKMPATPGSRSAFLTPTTGLAEIVEALVARLQGVVELRLNCPVANLARSATGYSVRLASGEQLEVGAVILATPAWASAGLLTGLNPDLAAALQTIPYTSTATITLAYRQSDVPRALDGYGYIIPSRAGRRALASTWTSTKFPHRAPEGYALIRIFAGRAGQEQNLPGDEPGLLALAREELAATLGVKADPLVSRVFTWDKAMPQYNLGHGELLKRMDAALQGLNDLALAGNGYRGIGIPDCIHSAELAVEKILPGEGAGVQLYSTLAEPVRA